jgi:hypothetical protein
MLSEYFYNNSKCAKEREREREREGENLNHH